MDFVFRILNHYFEKGTPWVDLDKIKQRSWFLSVDIEDDEVVPCYDTVSELRLSKGVAFKSVKILTGKTQETFPYWEALLDMSYLNSTELRDVTFKDLPGESGIYMLNIWFDYDGEELNFGDDFKKLCEFRRPCVGEGDTGGEGMTKKLECLTCLHADITYVDQYAVIYCILKDKEIYTQEECPEFTPITGKVKKQPPDLTAGEFNRRE